MTLAPNAIACNYGSFNNPKLPSGVTYSYIRTELSRSMWLKGTVTNTNDPSVSNLAAICNATTGSIKYAGGNDFELQFSDLALETYTDGPFTLKQAATDINGTTKLAPDSAVTITVRNTAATNIFPETGNSGVNRAALQTTLGHDVNNINVTFQAD